MTWYYTPLPVSLSLKVYTETKHGREEADIVTDQTPHRSLSHTHSSRQHFEKKLTKNNRAWWVLKCSEKGEREWLQNLHDWKPWAPSITPIAGLPPDSRTIWSHISWSQFVGLFWRGYRWEVSSARHRVSYSSTTFPSLGPGWGGLEGCLIEVHVFKRAGREALMNFDIYR